MKHKNIRIYVEMDDVLCDYITFLIWQVAVNRELKLVNTDKI